MTECGVIEDGNVLRVTMRQRAAVRAKEDAERQRTKYLSQAAGMGNGFAGGLDGYGPGPDLTAEIAKLKEQK